VAFYFDAPFIQKWLLHLSLNESDVSDICIITYEFRMIARIIKRLIANGLPTTEGKS